MKRLFLTGLGCFLILSAAIAQTAFLLIDNGPLYRLEIDSLSLVDLGFTSAYIPYGLEAMDDGRLLSVGYTDPEDDFPDLFDFQTMPGHVVAPVTPPQYMNFGPAEYDGRLYGIDWDANVPYESRLLEMDSQTGEVRTIAVFPGMGITDIAVDENGNGYLMQRMSPSVGELFRVDLVTGNLTDVGKAPFIAGFDFTATGELIGSDRYGGIYQVNPLTGEGTYLFDTPLTGVVGFTVVVPEPATGAVLGIGVLGLLALRMHRKHKVNGAY